MVGHGDPCLPNVFFDDEGSLTGLIDVDRLGTADRYNDLAIATRSLARHWHPRYAEQFLLDYGVTQPDTSKIAFSGCSTSSSETVSFAASLTGSGQP